MSVTELLPLTALVLGITLPGMFFCLWAAKKAGIQPVDHYRKLSFDNCTYVRDTRTMPRHRSYFRSKKDGTVSIEVIHSRGSIVLEFYTEKGRVLQSWRNGDPLQFEVPVQKGQTLSFQNQAYRFTGSAGFRYGKQLLVA